MNCIFPQCVNNQVKGEFCIQHGKLFGETVKVLKKPLKRTDKKKTKKVKLESLPKLKIKAQKVMNAYIRNRDRGLPCISCGNSRELQAGHYVPEKQSAFLRYHEWNINGECGGCNCFDAFHLIGYRKRLIEKIGLEAVEWLENNKNQVKKWTREELEEIIQKYRPVKGETDRGDCAA